MGHHTHSSLQRHDDILSSLARNTLRVSICWMQTRSLFFHILFPLSLSIYLSLFLWDVSIFVHEMLALLKGTVKNANRTNCHLFKIDTRSFIFNSKQEIAEQSKDWLRFQFI